MPISMRQINNLNNHSQLDNMIIRRQQIVQNNAINANKSVRIFSSRTSDLQLHQQQQQQQHQQQQQQQQQQQLQLQQQQQQQQSLARSYYNKYLAGRSNFNLKSEMRLDRRNFKQNQVRKALYKISSTYFI